MQETPSAEPHVRQDQRKGTLTRRPPRKRASLPEAQAPFLEALVSMMRRWKQSHGVMAWSDLLVVKCAMVVGRKDDEEEQLEHLGSRFTQCMDVTSEPADHGEHQSPGKQRLKVSAGRSIMQFEGTTEGFVFDIDTVSI